MASDCRVGPFDIMNVHDFESLAATTRTRRIANSFARPALTEDVGDVLVEALKAHNSLGRSERFRLAA